MYWLPSHQLDYQITKVQLSKDIKIKRLQQSSRLQNQESSKLQVIKVKDAQVIKSKMLSHQSKRSSSHFVKGVNS